MNATSDKIILELLTAIESNGRTSQRDLARHTGVALGLVNSYIKRCVRKGWVKINEVPANRYFYYVTPKGFSEKMRLTTRYVSESFSFYRRAASSCEQMLKLLYDQEINSIMLFGISDLAEIVFLKSLESPVEIIGIVDTTRSSTKFFTTRVWHDLPLESEIDVVVLTDIVEPDKSYRAIASVIDQKRIFVPEILGGWSGKTINATQNII